MRLLSFLRNSSRRGVAAGPESVKEEARKRGLYIGNHEDRRPHELQDHGEHLHPRAGRDAEEGDGEYGRSVREQGEGLTGWDFDGSGRLPGYFAFWIAKTGGKWYNIGKVNDLNKN